jgi:pimeloyl-ACP methyl ester carboxylesterase
MNAPDLTGHVAHHSVFTPDVVNEYLRTFSGEEGVLGSMGIYRAAFSSIEQTEPLTTTKVAVPVIALGGERGLGDRVGEMVKMVAQTVEAHTITDCGHFIPEERPEVVVKHVLAMAGLPSL